MPSKAEAEAAASNERRARDQALAAAALRALIGDAHPDDALRGAPLAAALMAIVDGWRAEVISLEGVTRRGTTGRKADLRTAAGLLAQVAKDVASLPAPSDGPDEQRRIAVANQQAERIATMGPMTANLPLFDPTKVLPGPVIAGSFGPGEANPFDLTDEQLATRLAEPVNPDPWAAPGEQQPTTMPAMDGGPPVPALFIGETATPPAGRPEYAVGDQVTVGGIDFTKISDNPFPSVITGNGPVRVTYLEAQHQQAMADAAAYLSGTTDVDPLTSPTGEIVQPVTVPAPFEVFDPSPRQPTVKRLTYGEVGAFWSQIAPLDHKSHSQVETASDCGMKALLSRAARSKLIPGGQPQWATVGGSAFHSAIETIEIGIQQVGGAGPETPSILQSLWLGALDAAIIGTETQTQTDRKDWRVANKGLEGYDWWRVEGERMVKLYLDYHTVERRQAASILRLKDAAGGPDRLAIELPFRLDVDGVADDGFVDQVWYDQASPTPFAVRDLKTGRSEPDTFQLAGYAWALSKQWSVPIEMFTGAFWLARKGIYSTPIVIAERHPWEEMVFRFHNAQRMEEAQVAIPRVSNFCNGCEFRALCPAGPR